MIRLQSQAETSEKLKRQVTWQKGRVHVAARECKTGDTAGLEVFGYITNF